MQPEERIARLKAKHRRMLAARQNVPGATREFLAESEEAKHDPEHPMSYNQQAQVLGTSRQAIEQLADRHLPRERTG